MKKIAVIFFLFFSMISCSDDEGMVCMKNEDCPAGYYCDTAQE